MADNHVDGRVEGIIEEQLPNGIQIDGIGDIPEGGDDVKVPLMKNGEPYPSHIVAEDLGHDPDYSDTGTDDDDDPYEDWDWDYDDDDEEDDEEATATESDSPHYPHDRFSNFAAVSAALFGDALRSVLSVEGIQQLEFGTQSGDVLAYFSIKIER